MSYTNPQSAATNKTKQNEAMRILHGMYWIYPLLTWASCLSMAEQDVNIFVFLLWWWLPWTHYSDVIVGAMASQISSSPSLAFMRGIHRWPVNSPHKGPVTRKLFQFDDVIMMMIMMMMITTRYAFNHTLFVLVGENSYVHLSHVCP